MHLPEMICLEPKVKKAKNAFLILNLAYYYSNSTEIASWHLAEKMAANDFNHLLPLGSTSKQITGHLYIYVQGIWVL